MGGRGSVSASSTIVISKIQTGHDYGGYTPEERAQLVADQLNVPLEKATELAESIFQWSIDRYSDVRAYQQNPTNAEGERLARNVEEYIAKADKWGGGTTYRGINNVSEDVFAQLTTPGSVIGMNGTSSWSTNEATAWEFGGEGVVFVSETQSKGTSIRHLARGKHENEVIVSKDARYRVKSTGSFAGKTYVYLDEI